VPDWQELVRRRLAGLALEPCDKEEVLTELAGHLEEIYESLRKQGSSKQEAMRRALAQVTDWQELQRKIYSARTKETIMTPRTTRFWLPSLATLILSMLLLPVLEWVGLRPQVLFLRGGHEPGHTYVFTAYTAWLILLPLVGALGAYLSSRAGGTRQAIITSGIFPALAFAAVLLFCIPFMGLLEHGLERGARPLFHSWSTEPFGALGVVAGWVLVPGVSLLIGVLAYSGLARWRVKPAS
jgi:hypothetical protein